MKKVDIDNWDRKHQYRFYSTFDDPIFGLTANIDISVLYSYCKEHKIKLFPAYLYLSQCVTNAIPEFRMRIVDHELVEFSAIHSAPTIAAHDNTFRFSVMKMKPNFKEFYSEVELKTKRALAFEGLDLSYLHKDVIYYTVVPWVTFTAFKNPNLYKGEDVPRIAFGKFEQVGKKLNLPVSVEANHGIMDGYHMGMYFTEFQNLVNEPECHL